MLGVLLILMGFAIVVHVLGAPPYASLSIVFGVSGVVVFVWGF
jgi:vacuolar-type H+-ATPase subunit I/STV1